MKIKSKGFTLVELIITITILVILTTVGFIGYSNSARDSRDANRLVTVDNIYSGLQLFKGLNAFFPDPDEITGTGSFGGVALNVVGKIGTNVSGFIDMEKVPTDPLSQEKYAYGVSADNKYVQVATIMEGEMANNMSSTVYADGYQSKVVGNYLGLLSISNMVYNLPSLIFATGGNITYPGQDPYFVINKGGNLPYSLNGKAGQKNQNISGVFSQLTGTSSVVFTGMLLPNILSKNTLLANSGAYAKLGYGMDTIGKALIGKEYGLGKEVTILGGIGCSFTQPSCAGNSCTLTIGTPSLANQAWVLGASHCGYTCNANYSGTNCATYTPPGPPKFLANCTNASSVGGIIYTDATGTEIGRVTNTGSTISGNPNTLTCAGHIIVCSGNNAGYVLQACNVGATTVYTNQTYPSAISLRDTTMNAWLGGLYQWGRNEDISMGTYVSTTYNGVLTNGNVGNTNFYKGDGTYGDWWQTEAGSSSPTRWTGTNVQGPCPSGYHIPTGGGSGEWSNIYGAGGWLSVSSNPGTGLSNSLRLPFAGYRYWAGGTMDGQGISASYCSVTPLGAYAYGLGFDAGNINPAKGILRGNGVGIRCIKN